MTKVLFVDDEPTIRLTLPKILEMHEFEVRAAANVQDALKLIQEEKFDVLLSDLNIGEPSDGFTVVSAMRRVQPDAITIILTGYPAFETALQAIREQVDDYISKPANVDDLITKIKDKVKNHTRHVLAPLRKTYKVLESNRDLIVAAYVTEIKKGEFPVAGLSDADIRNSMPKILSEIMQDLESGGNFISGTLAPAAEGHGRLRYRQGFKVHHLIEEARLLRDIVYGVIQQNMLSLDASTVVGDMVRIGDCVDSRLVTAVNAYLDSVAAPDQTLTSPNKTAKRSLTSVKKPAKQRVRRAS